jgi:hypothetical protein
MVNILEKQVYVGTYARTNYVRRTQFFVEWTPEDDVHLCPNYLV